jgi:FKBP-type peptidyl-prolyl cis-trans isomerase
VLGKSKIIKGWEEGIPTMEKKEVAMVRLIYLYA